jgi:hypothetical protein
MRSGVTNCHILSMYYGESGKLLASTHPTYEMLDFPNIHSCRCLSSRDPARPDLKIPKGDHP